MPLALITWLTDPTPPQPPLGIWGPGDPRPTLPIAGWNPGTGTWPTPPGGGQPPLGIWGPGDPRPTLPIAGWNPGTGNFPNPPGPPLGIWGPGDPRPTLPIAGWNPGTGTWPQPPTGGTEKPPGTAGQLPASDPSGSGWVYCFVPGYGWMWAQVPPPPATTKPDGEEKPVEPVQPA